MKRFFIGMLIVGGVIAAIAVVVRRRSGSGVDDWDSLAEDSNIRASQSASTVADAAKEWAPTGADAAKDA